MKKYRVLFACNGPSGRSLMAEAFARKIAPKDVTIIAAGDSDKDVHPIAVEIMKEEGFELPPRAISIETINTEPFDVVITLCQQLQENCPHFIGSPARIHWGLTDPILLASDEEEIRKHYRRLIDEIKNRVRAFFEHGYLEGILEVHLTFGSILNTMTDGVMAHDAKRRIFFFNKSAEEITGYTFSEVIGRDCHSVIPGKFCGGNCVFCNEEAEYVSKLKFNSQIIRPDGHRRDLELSIIPLEDAEHHNTGALVIFRDQTEVHQLRHKLEEDRSFQGIVGKHPSMLQLYNSIRDLAAVNVPVLIQGESGTGKELAANALHKLSKRKDRPFVPVNCGALPEGTLESELFGHVKGAFTGAIKDKRGRFALADGGVIFLDEIGEISHSMQVQLLRVLQEREFIPVGGEKSIKVDVRVICATNKNLKEQVKKGNFREDLFYRLAVVPLNIPPLRERKTDIPLLIDHFEELSLQENQTDLKEFMPEALNCFINYEWPGNVRELGNAVQFALIKSHTDYINIEDLPLEIKECYIKNSGSKRGRKPKLNREDVLSTIKRFEGNKAKAADFLSVSRTTLYRYLEELPE